MAKLTVRGWQDRYAMPVIGVTHWARPVAPGENQ